MNNVSSSNDPTTNGSSANPRPPPAPPGDDASASSGPLSSDSVLTIAVRALTTIATEAQQAAKSLRNIPPVPVPVPVPVAPVAERSAFALTPAISVNGPPPVHQPTSNVPTGPTAKAGVMNPGEVLHPGDAISSSNGNYRLVLQTDGNLVLYSGTSALWASGTNSKPVAVCIMQADGNLVLYDRSAQAVWASHTNGKPGAHLDVQNDGNVVISPTTGGAAWTTNTVHTIGSDTLIYRARIKRWTNNFLFGSKGNDTILVKLPPGATLKSVTIEAINTDNLNPNVNSAVGTQVGSSWSGARLTNVVTGPGFVAITTHWWFNAFSDAEYSIAVWVTGPDAYPVEDNGTLMSANLDSEIAAQAGKWFENNVATLIAAAVAVASVCADIATLGTATPITTPVLVAAIGAAIAAGSKVVLSPG
jgi:hypothetical protein